MESEQQHVIIPTVTRHTAQLARQWVSLATNVHRIVPK